jgi:hypothetical protein
VIRFSQIQVSIDILSNSSSRKVHFEFTVSLNIYAMDLKILFRELKRTSLIKIKFFINLCAYLTGQRQVIKKAGVNWTEKRARTQEKKTGQLVSLRR